jgi:hypothetical protein
MAIAPRKIAPPPPSGNAEFDRWAAGMHPQLQGLIAVAAGGTSAVTPRKIAPPPPSGNAEFDRWAADMHPQLQGLIAP